MINYKYYINLLILTTILTFTQSAYAFSFGSLFSFGQVKPTAPKTLTHAISNQPVHVKVGIYALHIGKFDLQSASTRVDFYLIFRCSTLCNSINFEIMNATNSTIHLITKQNDSLVYRIQADISKSDSLRSYPFDDHTLDIVIESRQLTADKMIFEVDPSITALDSSLDVIGFDFSPHWTAQVTNHYYKTFNKTSSSYKFSMYIKRPWLAGIIKGILPPLIIILSSFLALFLKINHLAQRLSITTSALIASVVFHLNITGSIPPLGYATYADMFMFINYFCLLVILIEVIVTTHYIETKHHDLAERINRLCAAFIPLTWLLIQIVNWFVFNPNA